MIHQWLLDQLKKAGGQIKRSWRKMSCFETMHVRFNQDCFEQFKAENFCGPTKRLGISRIIINEDNHKELNEKKERTKRYGHNIFVTDITRHWQFVYRQSIFIFGDAFRVQLYTLSSHFWSKFFVTNCFSLTIVILVQ